MEKVVRIGSVNDQDEFRREDCRKMTHDERVNAVLTMQSQFLRWDLNPKMKRVGKLVRKGHQDVS